MSARTMISLAALSLGATMAVAPLAASAQGGMQGHDMHDMPGMGDAPSSPQAPSASGHAAHDQHAVPATQAPAHDHAAMAGMGDMPGMEDMSAAGHMMPMPAMLGPYAMSREASGTGWQPDSSPVYATMRHSGDWMAMAQGNATLVYSDQGGPRGDRETFVESMAMLMASRPAGEHGRIGLRAMLSLDPLMGARGYPLLFATGETADGVTKLVDRQHPHDLFMELAASYSHDLGGGRAVFLYAGLPGEPALGAPTFMHRPSGMDSPEAPIGHHWFDSTHITWGVVTAGFSTRHWKIEASAFKGREPDQYRWDIEAPKLDSWSVRAFWNPTPNLSLQASTGHIHSPEQLHPDQDEQRTVLSISHNLPLGDGANWASTVAWSLKDAQPGPALNGWLAETALRWADRHTVFARAERVEQAELFDHGNPLHDRIVPVSKLSVGYQYELPVTRDLRLAIGALASAYAYPALIEPYYGRDGVKSAILYTRIMFGDRRLRR